MGEVEANPNWIYIAPDLLREIFVRLPFKSLVRFKSVSKEWRSILESNWFAEMHLSFQKSGKGRRKILAASSKPPCLHHNSRTEEEGEEMVFLHCDPERPSMTCDGLVCIPLPDCINVLNPSTGQHWRFPSGLDLVPPPAHPRRNRLFWIGAWSIFFPGYCAMGFGRDKVGGSYKVVRMYFSPRHFDILDVNIGEWRKLNPPPFDVEPGRRSASVNGYIYWLDLEHMYGIRLLALDLHSEEFQEVRLHRDMNFRLEAQIVNFEDNLAIASTRVKYNLEWYLDIWIMDIEERWSKRHSISLACFGASPLSSSWFRPVIVSKQGNIVIHDDRKRLYKYYKRTNTILQIFPHTCVISPYIESLVRLQDEHVELRTETACICGTTCDSKDGLALARGSFQSRVDKYLCKGKYLGGLLRSKFKMLTNVSCAAKLICVFWLACFDWGHIFKIMVILLLLKIGSSTRGRI